jgi:hypothetical protein
MGTQREVQHPPVSSTSGTKPRSHSGGSLRQLIPRVSQLAPSRVGQGPIDTKGRLGQDELAVKVVPSQPQYVAMSSVQGTSVTQNHVALHDRPVHAPSQRLSTEH